MIGLGCMRLSTERDRDESRAVDVLHAALDAGITFFDTADAYCWDEHDVGHNERLIARALSTWTGDRSRVIVATKGGLTRPAGRWVPNGRARTPAGRVRRESARARRQPDRAVSAARAGSANAALDERARAGVANWAAAVGLPVRCLWLSTSIEDAQVNAVNRMLSTYGRLLGPDEMRQATKTDVNAFGPGVQFRYQRDLEPPDPSEGFSRIDRVAFERTHDPSCTERAVIVWCDNVLVRSRTGQRAPVLPEDIEPIEGRAETLRRYAESGWRLLGLAWRPEVSEERITGVQAEAGFARMQELLGVPIDVQYCPHGGGPPICWCRKPLPGLAVAFNRKYRLDASQCIYVGAGSQDPGFARRIGFQYRDATEFFAPRLGV